MADVKMTDTERILPHLSLFTPAIKSRLFEAAVELLGKFGVWFEDSASRHILLDAGAIPAPNDTTRLLLKRDLIEQALEISPNKIMLYNATGDVALDLSGENSHYAPGSAALNLFEWQNQKERPAKAADLLNLIKITNRLDVFEVQSTSLIPSDVPQALSDCYRLYLALLFSDKPIVTGLFQFKSFQIMYDLLVTIRGTPAALEAKPLAIMDCCPISPLRWGEPSCQTIKSCAVNGIPVELVPMLLPGATAPIDLYSACVQYLAEILSGGGLVQLVRPGAPVIAGNAPAVFDMRTIAPAVGRTETMLYMTGCAQLTKALNLPTHAYACVSDTKILDIETGIESGMGALVAATSGINLIAGAGMLESLNSFSFEKLLLDHEILRMAGRFKTGIMPHPEQLIEQFFEAAENENQFLLVEKTLKLYRQEYIYPAAPLSHNPDFAAVNAGNLVKAHQQVLDMMNMDLTVLHGAEKSALLTAIMNDAGKSIGITQFPYLWSA